MFDSIETVITATSENVTVVEGGSVSFTREEKREINGCIHKDRCRRDVIFVHWILNLFDEDLEINITSNQIFESGAVATISDNFGSPLNLSSIPRSWNKVTVRCAAESEVQPEPIPVIFVNCKLGCCIFVL